MVGEIESQGRTGIGTWSKEENWVLHRRTVNAPKTSWIARGGGVDVVGEISSEIDGAANGKNSREKSDGAIAQGEIIGNPIKRVGEERLCRGCFQSRSGGDLRDLGRGRPEREAAKCGDEESRVTALTVCMLVQYYFHLVRIVSMFGSLLADAWKSGGRRQVFDLFFVRCF